MKLSIVVPTFNRSQLVGRLLDSLIHQSLAKNNWEILIISNLKDDELKSLCDRSPLVNCYYHEVGSIGVNKARNLGISFSQGEVILFIDDDCEFPDNEFLQRVADLHIEFAETAGIGGRYLAPDELNHPEFSYHLNSDLWLLNSMTSENKTTNLVGGCSSYKKSVFSEDFQFNEEIAFGGSETDFNLRLISKGLTLRLCPEHDLIHRPSLNLTSLLRKAFKQGIGARRRQAENITTGKYFRERQFDSLSALKKLPKKYSPMIIRLLLLLFDFSFQVGFRYYDEKKRVPIFPLVRSIFLEILYRIFHVFRRGIFNEVKYSFKYWFRS